MERGHVMKKSLLSIAVLTLLLTLFPRMLISSIAEENDSTPQAPAGIQLVEGFESVSSIQPGDSRLVDAQNRVSPLIYQNLTLFENCDIYEITLFVTGTIVDNDATNKNDPPIDDNTEYTLDILILDSASIKAGEHYTVKKTYTISVSGSEIKKNDWNTFDVSHLGITVNEGETLGFGSTSSTLEFFYLNSRVDSDLCYWGHNTTTGDTTLRLRKNFNLPIGVTGYNAKKAEQEAHCSETLQMLKEKLAGKYLSVFGASMCTYDGYSNDATTNSTIGNNKVYYTARQMNAEDTFWMQVVDELDMKLLVNNSWSGSAVSFVRAGAQPAYLDRCRQLHADTGVNAGTNPDIIVSFMGCNDYKQPGVILGTVSPEMLAIIDQNVNNDDYRGETFAECYAMMLARVVAYYPHAEVFVFNMPYTAKYSLEDAEAYHDVISTIAEYYGCHVIDLAHSKMSGANYTPYSLDGLHPNAEGMDIWTELIIGEFIDCFLTNQSPDDHEYNRVDKQPTCVTQGFTQYTCVCGSSYIENKVSALGHSYDEGVVTAAPDCTSAGVKTFTCDTCGETYTETLPAIGHVEENIPAVAPTCTETGLTAGAKCSVCGEILTVQEEVPALGHNYLPVITDSTCTSGGYTTYTCSICNDSYMADETPAAGHAYDDGVERLAPTYTKEGFKTFTCTACGDTYTEVIPSLRDAAGNEPTPYQGKVFSIMGGSCSTFAGYIPTADGFNLAHRARYPQDNLLTDVNETWWMQVLTELGAKLGINDSWAGSQVLNTLDANSGDLGPDAAMASLVRIQNLGSNGTPDVILFYGAGNDIGRAVPLGVFDPATAPQTVDLTTTKWDTFADAYVAAILRMKHFYPSSNIVVMLYHSMPSYFTNAELSEYNALIQAICDHYNIPTIDLRNSGVTADMLPDKIHPNAEGMDLITQTVLDELIRDCLVTPGENVVYSVSHELTNATASKHYYKGISAGHSFSETITGTTVTVTMNGIDITSTCYSDGTITIPEVTGDVVITVKGEFNADGHLQQLPDRLCCGINLWTVLEPENIYYTANGWGLFSSAPNVHSITFPVTPGNKIWATSFKAAGENGNTANATRITWFDENGVLRSVARDEVYAEFSKNGYITVPEGAIALNLPMARNDASFEVYVTETDFDTGHSYDNGVETLAPSCTVDGVKTFTCEICGSTSTESIPAAGHAEEAIPAVAPSCTDTGLTEGVQCSICGEVLTVPSEVAALGHSHIAVITAPTCTEKGFTTYTCSTCGDSYVSNEVAATGHSYDDGVITTTPACTAGGIKTFTCEVCGDSYTETISATGHMEEAIPAVAPTCTAPGLTAGMKCSVCGEILTAQAEVAVLGHTYDDGIETTAPTCTEDGIKTFTCTVCGNAYTEVIIATDHNYMPVVTDSTCTGVGYTTYTCSTCGDSYTSDETPASGHSYDAGVVTTAPTCTEEGVRTFTCSACGIFYTVSVPATGHAQEIIPAVPPTCTETGLTTGMKCSVCGEILTAQTEVPAFGHSYNSGVETTAPTCTAGGVKTFTCGGCGDSYTEALPALGHIETTLPAVAPTCTTVGQTEGLHCSTCGTVFITQEILPALGHAEGEPVITVEPTVQTAGIRSVFCDTCGELIRSESITVTGSLYIPGDADDNGHVDIYDALLVMQYSAGWDVTPNLLNADISKDGIVDLYDAVMILQYCAGTSFDSALRALLEKAEELLIDVMTILEHPQDQHIIEGQQAVFRLSAAGEGLQYQWYIDRGNGDGWRPIAGATSDAYIISAVQITDDSCRYRCGITDAFGRQIMSNPAILYVEPAVELPQTGDQSNLLLWTTLMAVSLCCLVGLVVAGKRHSLSK